MPDVVGSAAIWKRLAAWILDFCMVGLGGGYLIALATGETAKGGFHLRGASAMALWALVVLYFFIGERYAGGTLWDRLFGVGGPRSGDAAMSGAAAGSSLGLRAGFWRRGFALAVDSAVISALFQLVVAVLFVATSGRIQVHGDVRYTNCSVLESVPEGLTPPPAGPEVARECRSYFFGAQTARTLQVGRAAEDGIPARAASRTYMLDRDGHLVAGMPVDWVAALALIAYLVAMETRSGATLGSRMMGIRVIDAAAPAGPGVPLRKVVMRYLAVLTGFVPTLAALLVYFGLYGSPDALRGLVLELSRGDAYVSGEIGSRTFEWHPVLGAYLFGSPGTLLGIDAASFHKIALLLDFGTMMLTGWVILLGIQIAMKRDPLYDQMAGTAVVRA